MPDHTDRIPKGTLDDTLAAVLEKVEFRNKNGFHLVEHEVNPAEVSLGFDFIGCPVPAGEE